MVDDCLSFSDWNQFDPEEYSQRNFGRELLYEDACIIKTCIAALNNFGIKPGQVQRYVDIGSGPNLYPAMIMSPFVSDDGTISLLDFATSNWTYLNNILAEQGGDSKIADWLKFEQLMKSVDEVRYNHVLERLLSRARAGFGDIFNMPAETYDAVSSFFVAESITDEFPTFIEATRNLLNSLKNGGIVVAAHMVGSGGWFAGEGTNFPAISLTVPQIESAYSILQDFSVTFFTHGLRPAARDGYSGMALVVGRKFQPELIPGDSSLSCPMKVNHKAAECATFRS
jgi:16S rRNA G527 N7-methylase RsmG